MQFLSILTAVLVVFSTASICFSQLVVYESGTKSVQGPTLTDGLVFCPSDFTSKGFNILCVASDAATWAKFYVDDTFVKRERAKPYFIAGDKDGRVKQWQEWEQFKGTGRVIKCEQSDGTVYSAEITLSCESDSQSSGSPSPSVTASPSSSSQPSVTPSRSPIVLPSSSGTPQPSGTSSPVPSPSFSSGVIPSPIEDISVPGTLLLHPSGLIGDNFIPVTNGMTFCPEIFPYGEFSVQCVESSASTRAVFFVNGIKAKSESITPYFIAGDAGGKAYAWEEYPEGEPFTLSCVLNDGTTSTATMTVMCDEEEEDGSTSDEEASGDGVTTSRSGCVVIDAKVARLSEDWYETGDGVSFRPNVEGTYVAAAGKFPLSYEFTAPVTTQYGFVIDMTTGHSTEHNDVWAWFPGGGFQLMRGGMVHEDERKGQGWTKVYHNKNGRAMVSSSVDFAPHSMATKERLVEDGSYEVVLAGRSSKVVVHRIIMFPCEGSGCQRDSSNWKKRLAECSMLG